MGNTQATDKQFSDRYALKSAYDGTVVIVDQHTSQIAGIINAANQLAARVDTSGGDISSFKTATNTRLTGIDATIAANKLAYDNYVTSNNKSIADNKLAYDNYVSSNNTKIINIEKSLSDDKTAIAANKLAYDAYVNTTNGALTAIGNRITNEIIAANKLTNDQFAKVSSDLKDLGIRVGTIDQKFSGRFSAIESDLANYKTVTNTSIKSLSDAYYAFISNLNSNYKFGKVNIGQDWFLHTQAFNNIDNLCIGKKISGTDKLLMCLDTTGNLNYTTMNQNSTYGTVTSAFTLPPPPPPTDCIYGDWTNSGAQYKVGSSTYQDQVRTKLPSNPANCIEGVTKQSKLLFTETSTGDLVNPSGTVVGRIRYAYH
jgi:hypothetical protein